MRGVCVGVKARPLLLVAAFFFAFMFPREQLAAADASALSKQIDDLGKALTNDAAKDDAAQASLSALLAKVATTDCSADASKKADCKLAQLTAFAGQTKTAFDQYKIALTTKQQGDLVTSLQPWLSLPVPNTDAHLLSALDFASKQLGLAKAGVFQPDAVVTSLGGVITSATPPIIAAKPAGLPKAKVDAMAQTIQAAQKNMDQLIAALSADKRINILGAWYGDLKSISRAQPKSLDPWKYTDRFCSATLAVRARCQGKPLCYEPNAPPTQIGTGTGATFFPNADGVTSELIGSQLCGYEPATFANPKDKGVLVSYQCVVLDAETWKTIGTGNPVKKGDSRLEATLRTSTIEEIRCQGNYQQ